MLDMSHTLHLFVTLSDQFRTDVQVNPLDVEEIVWDIASQSRLNPSEIPPKSMMSLPPGKSDRRKIMVSTFAQLLSKLCSVSLSTSWSQATVYAVFRDEATELDLATAGHGGK